MLSKLDFLAKGLAVLGLLALAGCTTSALSSVATVEEPAPIALPVAAAPGDAATVDAAQSQLPPAGRDSRFDPVALAPEPVPPAPEMGSSREEAIRMIRAKADSLPDEKPNVFDTSPSVGWKRTPQEVEAVRQQMQEAARRNSGVISDREAAAKASEAQRLKARAQRHYEDALKEIEN